MKNSSNKSTRTKSKARNNESYPKQIPKNAQQFVVDWARKNNKDGKYTVSLINNNYYVYTKEGHKYIGSLKEDGIHESKRPRNVAKEENTVIDSSPVKVSNDYRTDEYGFSRTVIELCPDAFKEVYGQEWKACLVSMILKVSPNSYLRHLNPNISCNHHGARFLFEHKTGLHLSPIFETMSPLQVITRGKEKYITHLNDEQKTFCQKHNISLNIMNEQEMEATV